MITPRADIGFALATRLIAQRGKGISRQALIALFWPTAPGATAAHTLSEALHKLRRKGLPVRADDSYSVWIARDAASTDIERLGTQPPQALLERDLTILPGYSPIGSPTFQDWFDDYYNDLEQRLIAQLLNATARAEDDGDARTVMGLAEQLLKLDPTNEAALAATAQAVEALQRTATQRRNVQSHGGDVPGPVHLRPKSTDVPGVQTRPHDRARLGDAVSLQAAVSERVPRTGCSLPLGGFPAARDTTLVGRAADIGLISDLLDAAARGSGGGLYLSGAAGIGKSRLVRALSNIARDRGMAVASVACQQSDLLRPLSAFVDVVPKVRLLPGAAGASPSMAAYLDRLTKHAARDYAPDIDPGEMEHSYGCVQHAVLDLLESVSDEQPLVLVIENMQWLDSASCTLLREVSAWATARTVVFAFTSRERWDVSKCGEPPTALTLHTLLPLTDEAAAQHAMEYATAIGHVPPAALLDWCISASEGNPYLLEELLNHWVATNEQFATPRSLAALLDARIDRLTPMALHVLKICAVLGRNSTLSRIEKLLKQPPYELFGALEDLGAAGMLTTERDENSSGNNRILCRHDVLAQAAIARLSPAGLELLHRRAGQVLEAEIDGGPNSASVLWDCAGHWHAAGNSTRAVELGRSCVGHLLEVGLAHDAAEGCRRTVTFCTRNTDKLDVLTTLAHVLHLTRSWTELFPVIDEIRDQCSPKNLAQWQEDDLELLALDAQWHAHRDWNVTLENAVRCSLSITSTPHHRVRAGIIALKVATNLGNAAAIDDLYRSLEPVAQDASVSDIDRLILQMVYDSVRGNHPMAASSARDLLSAIRELTPEIRYLCMRANCATALCRAGELAEGEREYTNIVDRAVALHAHTIAGEISLHLMKTYVDAGRMEDAEIWAHRYIGLRRPQSELWHQRPLRLGLAQIELWRGNFDAAEHLLQNDSNPLWNDPVPLFQATALATQIQADIARQREPSSVAVLVAKLELQSAHLRSLGGQDFETLALYAGMEYTARRSEATSMLVNYVQCERRDISPLPPEIVAQVDAARPTASERDEA
ncbi:MAG: ATP-binding protein [Gemmatimonadaceae bacterium]